MKTYNFTELKKIAKDQDYLTACLQNAQGEKMLGFNTPRTKDVQKQLTAIEKRLKAEILPDGYYYVCLAMAVNKQNAPDIYPVVKGSETALLKENQAPSPQIILKEKAPDVLTWSEALKLHSELAQLREENKTLKAEIETLKNDLGEMEEGEGEPSESLVSLLKDQAPTLLAMVDRFFNLEEKKVSLKELELNKPSQIKTQIKTIQITPGTKEHLILIETYFKNGNQEKFDIEIEKLAEANPELYAQVLEKLNKV